ncbi:hypothetical protein PEC18_29710 [Paucibacter sp. O1-1]|nr:hypothetical protein [Paucibacter sp. O1-1]MDA3829918.1 hypothetical protein [Paucibacter sp. O1-1]
MKEKAGVYNDLFDKYRHRISEKPAIWPKNLYKFTYKQQLLLSKHIQSGTGIPQFRQSLDEIVNLEVKDSTDINKFIPILKT